MLAVDRGYELQRAVFARLTSVLAAQGVGGADVPVNDHIPSTVPRLHVRIDEWTYRPRGDKGRRFWSHGFTVHVFDDATSGRGEAVRLHGLISGALDGWVPLPEATALDLAEGFSAPADEPNAQHEIIRFTTIIGA